MSTFDEIGLSWKGKEYVVQPEKVMGLIEVVEDVITLEEISGKIQRAKISKAFAAALRYAAQNETPRQHCAVTQQDVYTALFSGGGSQIVPIINTLLLMMVPPEHLQESTQNVKEEANLPTAVKSANESLTKEKDS